MVETGFFLGHAFLNIYENPTLLRALERRSVADWSQPTQGLLQAAS